MSKLLFLGVPFYKYENNKMAISQPKRPKRNKERANCLKFEKTYIVNIFKYFSSLKKRTNNVLKSSVLLDNDFKYLTCLITININTVSLEFKIIHSLFIITSSPTSLWHILTKTNQLREVRLTIVTKCLLLLGRKSSLGIYLELHCWPRFQQFQLIYSHWLYSLKFNNITQVHINGKHWWTFPALPHLVILKAGILSSELDNIWHHQPAADWKEERIAN